MGAHLHFDCYSGISGDMTLGALVDVGVPFPDLVSGLNQLRLSGFTLRKRRVHRGAIHATKVDVVITTGLRKPLSLHRIHAILSASRTPGQDQATKPIGVRSIGRSGRTCPSRGQGSRTFP